MPGNLRRDLVCVQMVFFMYTTDRSASPASLLWHPISIQPNSSWQAGVPDVPLDPIDIHGERAEAYALRVSLLAPLVEPVVDILQPLLAPIQPRGLSRGGSNLGERHVGNDDGVQGAGSLLGGLVLREGSLIPRHLVADLFRLAFNPTQLAYHPLPFPSPAKPPSPRPSGGPDNIGNPRAIRTEVERGSGKGNRDTGTEGLNSKPR